MDEAINSISMYLMNAVIPQDLWECREYYAPGKLPYRCLCALKTAVIGGSTVAFDVLRNIQNSWNRCCSPEVCEWMLSTYKHLRPEPVAEAVTGPYGSGSAVPESERTRV